VGEEALEDRAPGVGADRALVIALDHVGEHLRRPSVQASLDQAECRVQGLDELIGPARVVEIVRPVDGAVSRERGGVGARLAYDVAQPVRPHRGGVAHDRPDRQSVVRCANRELLVGHVRDDLAQAPVVLRPHVIGGSDGRRAHS
jgi:hypothetical protein